MTKVSKKKIVTSAAILIFAAGLGYGVGTVGGACAARYHVRTHRIAKCHAYKYLHHAKTAHKLYKNFRRMHLTKKQSAAMVGLAYKESNMKVTAHQAGGGSGYGLYQVSNEHNMKHWCHKHHLNYRSVRGQAKYMDHEFIKPSKFNKTSGSLRHEAKLAEFKVERSAIPQTKLVYKYAKRVYRAFV